MTDVALAIDARRHRGWQEIDIRRSLEQAGDTFEVALTDRWSHDDESPTIHPGDPCTVEIDTERVLTGYVDDVLPDYDARRHRVIVSGRSRTGDLVDCSDARESYTWRGRTLLQIAREVAAPFDIEVVSEVDVGPAFRFASIEPGQPIYEGLEQLARIRALHLVTDVHGRLVITRPGTERIDTALELGVNIRVARGQFTDRDRFSDYIVQGQQPADDWTTGETAAHVRGQARDARIRRFRPTLILCDTSVDTPACRDRAAWERATRFGKSRGITYTVMGWRHREGLWTPGVLVPVRDHWMGLEADWLIESVQYLMDESGKRTEIRVVPPEAYDRVELPEQTAGEDSIWPS